MKTVARVTIHAADRLLAQASLSMLGDHSSLIIPLFHGIFPDCASAFSGLHDPQQGVTLNEFRMLLSYFAKAGYKFIRPDDVLVGLEAETKNIILTFDDGYFNNLAVLPILHEFEAPAVFFVSANHVREGKAFWWDVLFREMKRANAPASRLVLLQAEYKTLTNEEIEKRLKAEFKLDCLVPVGDMDRPLTPAELRQLARDRYAVIGNHTMDHAILTNYSPNGVLEQIEGGQEGLMEMSGSLPTSIAYPNGSWSPLITKTATAVGLRVGMTTTNGGNSTPIAAGGNTSMTLNRVMLWGGQSVVAQCDVFRSKLSIHRGISRILFRFGNAGY